MSVILGSQNNVQIVAQLFVLETMTSGLGYTAAYIPFHHLGY